MTEFWWLACSSMHQLTGFSRIDKEVKNMALTKEERQTVIKSAQQNEKDTGSTEVQIALLTKKIEKLTKHMTANPHDYSSKRGMDIIIARRKNLLSYLKRTNPSKFEELSKKKAK